MPFKYEDQSPQPAPTAQASGRFKYEDEAAAPTEKTPQAKVPAALAGKFGVGEAILNIVTGLAAKPISEVAGMAAMGYDTASGRNEGNAGDFQRHVQSEMTYQPRTAGGRMAAEYNPAALLGKGVDWVGRGVQQIAAPPGSGVGRQMLGAGLHEAINQAPQFIGMKGDKIAGAAGDALKDQARGWMQSAMKPTLEAQRTGKAGRAIDTMLDEGLNVSPGGVEKLQDRISSLNSQIANRIAASSAVIDKSAVASRIQPLIDKFKKQVNSTDDIAAIQRAHDDFVNHPLLAGPDIPVQLAQEMKQGTYKQLGDKSYGELKSASIEAQKTLARGLKEEIAKAVPEVRPLNAEESALLNALSVSERRVMMEANKNPAGLGWLTTSPAKFAGWMADRSGLFKSLIARMLNTGAEAAPTVGKLAPLGGVATTQAAGQLPPPPQIPQQQQ